MKLFYSKISKTITIVIAILTVIVFLGLMFYIANKSDFKNQNNNNDTRNKKVFTAIDQPDKFNNDFEKKDNAVVFTTDKTKYNRGQSVKIEIKNNLDETIFIARKKGCDLFNNIERQEDGIWKSVSSEFGTESLNPDYQLKCFERINQNNFTYSEVETWSTVYRVKLNPGESHTDLWDMTIYNRFVGNGTYRISYNYGLSQDTLGEILEYNLCSNSFLINNEIDENYLNNKNQENKTISVIKKFPEEEMTMELLAPEIIIKNQENEFKIILSGPNIINRDLSDSSLVASIRYDRLNIGPGISTFNLEDVKYSNCEKTADKVECFVKVLPLCTWDSDINFHIIVNQNRAPYRMRSPHLLVDNFNSANEICGNKIDDNCDGKIDGLDEQCDVYTIWIMPGEGLTNLSRRAISQYLEKFYTASYLNKEQKIYAEDYLRRKVTNDFINLKVGQPANFPKELIEDAIEKARSITTYDKNSLEKYKDVINYAAYKNVSVSDSLIEVESLWDIDDKTKSDLEKIECYRCYIAEDSVAWKTDTSYGDVVVYYENDDIEKIYYSIGVYMIKDDYRRGMISHTVRISKNGIAWDPVGIGYNKDGKNYFPASYAKMGGGTVSGTGIFFIDVKDYNKGRLYVKFRLFRSKDADITLGKNLRTNLDL